MSEMSTDRPVEIPSAVLHSWLTDLEDGYYNGERKREINEELIIESLRSLLNQHNRVKVVPSE